MMRLVLISAVLVSVLSMAGCTVIPAVNLQVSASPPAAESLFEWACVPDPYLIPQ
jgi:hypothetical protein